MQRLHHVGIQHQIRKRKQSDNARKSLSIELELSCIPRFHCLSPLNLDRRQFHRRVEPDFRNQIRIELDLRKLFMAGYYQSKTGVELCEKLFKVESLAKRSVL